MPRQLLGLHVLADTVPPISMRHFPAAKQFNSRLNALSGRMSALTDVGYWGKNGHHLDRTGCRVLDPKRTANSPRSRQPVPGFFGTMVGSSNAVRLIGEDEGMVRRQVATHVRVLRRRSFCPGPHPRSATGCAAVASPDPPILLGACVRRARDRTGLLGAAS